MSIMIKDIKIPKEKQICITVRPNGKCLYCDEDYKEIYETEVEEIPSHGRLIDFATTILSVLPSALAEVDVKPVVRGMWLTQEYMTGAEDYEDGYAERRAEVGDPAYCSKCGASAGLDRTGDYVLSNFCPNCGADMREVEE